MAKLLNAPINILPSLDSIFGAVLVGGIDRTNEANIPLLQRKIEVAKAARAYFIGNFQYNVFNNYYAVFYEIICTLNIKAFDVEQLKSIIDTNKDLILDSPYIDKSKFAQTEDGNIANDDDTLMAMTSEIIDTFVRLSYMDVDIDSFESACKIYIDWYKQAYYASVCQDMAIIMQDMGLDVKLTGKRTRHYQGLKDAQEYYNQSMKIMKSLEDESRIKSTVLDEQWYQDEMQNEDKEDTEQLMSIGIKEIDAAFGNLRRSNMLGIAGPPKGGKTRFTAYLVERALEMGYNVCVWPLEGTKEEWISMITSSCLTSVSYANIKIGGADEMIRIDSADILSKKYLGSQQIRQTVASAKQAIAVSDTRGRLSFIEGTAYVEDFLDVIQSHYDSDNPFDILVIDQLVNVMSKTGKGKTERISEAYMNTKDFIANKLKRPALGLMPCQLKQDAVDFLRKNPDETIDVTAGGESAETIRTPDFTIGLFSSKEERDSNMMKMYCVASRHTKSFADFTARCYLGSCFFMSEEDDITAK